MFGRHCPRFIEIFSTANSEKQTTHIKLYGIVQSLLARKLVSVRKAVYLRMKKMPNSKGKQTPIIFIRAVYLSRRFSGRLTVPSFETVVFAYAR